MVLKTAFLTATLLVASAAAAHSQIYTYVDADGLRHYTDVPDNNRYRLLIMSPRDRTASGDMISNRYRLLSGTVPQPVRASTGAICCARGSRGHYTNVPDNNRYRLLIVSPARRPVPRRHDQQSIPVLSRTSVVLQPVRVLRCISASVPRQPRHYTDVPDNNRYRLLIMSPQDRTASGDRYDSMLLAKAGQYDSIIEKAALSAAVEANLLRAVIVVESGFNSRAVSKRGAVGLMQLMPATATRFGVSNPYDPRQNVHAGARYLKFLIDRFGQDVRLALAAYNAGEEAVDRNGGQIPPFPRPWPTCRGC